MRRPLHPRARRYEQPVEGVLHRRDVAGGHQQPRQIGPPHRGAGALPDTGEQRTEIAELLGLVAVDELRRRPVALVGADGGAGCEGGHGGASFPTAGGADAVREGRGAAIPRPWPDLMTTLQPLPRGAPGALGQRSRISPRGRGGARPRCRPAAAAAIDSAPDPRSRRCAAGPRAARSCAAAGRGR